MIDLTSVNRDPTLSSTDGTLLLDNEFSDSGLWTSYEAGSRRGGSIMKMPDGKLAAVAACRTLTYGTAEQNAKTKTWLQIPRG